MFIDTDLRGHHKSYLNSLVEDIKHTALAVLPWKDPDIQCDQIVYNTPIIKSRTLFNYLRWMKELHQIALKNNIDIVHFLYGDYLYRYFGLGLNFFRSFKIIITFHHMPEDYVRMLSVKRIFGKISMGITHTNYIQKFLMKKGINNVKKIEYPYFYELKSDESNQKLTDSFFTTKAPVIAAIGETRENKGLDILLEALKKVKQPFNLLIAGKEVHFTKKFIKEMTADYTNNVRLILKYLSDEELKLCYEYSDIIVLPYKKSFGGASGPLVEGVWYKKTIIGPEYKSIGDIIKQNHLGYVFEVENSDSLALAIEKALERPVNHHEKYERFRESLSVEKFISEYFTLYSNQFGK